MTTQTLEQRNYVATEADIENLAGEMLTAQFTAESGPRRYLRCVVATTIDALGAPQRARNGKVERIDDEEKVRQLGALEAVLGKFYPAVVKASSADLPSGKARAIELNRRTNWARTQASAVRGWIRVGHDLRTLAAAKLTKAMLHVTPKARAPSPGRLRARVEAVSKDLVARVMELGAIDRAAAISEIELLVGQLAAQLEEFGAAPTRDPKVAAAEHRPLKVGKAVFFPTQTQIVRQMEQPS